MKIPFDDNTGEKYTLEISLDDIDTGDGVILELNKKACEAFSQLFLSLSESEEDTHIHLGYDESEPQGPGWRIIVRDDS